MSEIDTEKVFLAERRTAIAKLLSERRKAGVAELSVIFRVGEATIRRDLRALEERGLVQRTHGGVLIMENASREDPFREREAQNREAKQRIAAFISQLVHNNETLLIDGGSTTMQVARMLRTKSGLVVVTNCAMIGEELVGASGFQVILTGGELREPTRTMVGPIADNSVRQVRADRVILGMSGLVIGEGFFTVNHYEAEVKRNMIRSGKEAIIAMDASKIGKMTTSFVCDFSVIDKLVTDDSIPTEERKRIEDAGVEVFAV